jgi:hypothetical protein
MLILFLILALIFLTGGGVGLFQVNVNVAAGTSLWICGNITFGVFLAVGIVILVFMALFNNQFE